MVKKKTSTKNTLKNLRSGIVSDVKKMLSAQDAHVEKMLVTQNTNVKKMLSAQDAHVEKSMVAQDARIKKLLLAQDIRNWAKMEELEEKFEKHVTKLKSDFHEEIDPVLKEVIIAQEERPLIENRIEALEEIHTQGKHSLAVA